MITILDRHSFETMAEGPVSQPGIQISLSERVITKYLPIQIWLMGSIKHMLASKPKYYFILTTSCLILIESWLFLVSEYLCFVCLCPQIKKLWMFELMVSTFYQNETLTLIVAS